MRRASLIIACIMLARMAHADVDPTLQHSIEVAAESSEVIIHARLVSRTPPTTGTWVEGLHNNHFWSPSSATCTFEAIEFLKGKHESPLEITTSLLDYHQVDLRPGAQVILASRRDHDESIDFWIHTIDSTPLSPWTADLRQLSGSAVLATFRAAIANPPLPTGNWHHVNLLNINPNPRLFEHLLSVPDGPSLQVASRSWIASPHWAMRLEGVRALEANSDADIQLLKSLLHDPATVERTDHNNLPYLEYPVRHAAYGSLRYKKVPADVPVYESPSRLRRLLAYYRWPLTISLAPAILAPATYIIARRNRRRRGLHLERISYLRLAFSAAALTSLAIAIFLAISYLPGFNRFLLTYDPPDSLDHYGLDLIGKHLMFRRQTSVRLSKSLSWDRPPWSWYRQASRGYSDKPLGWLGFKYRSSVSNKWVTPPSTWQDLTINKLHLILLLSLLPAFWLYHQLHFHQRRRRAARALCIACGYDLRASPTQCPECGHIPPTRGTPARTSHARAV